MSIHAETDPLARDFGSVSFEETQKVEAILRIFMTEVGKFVESPEVTHLHSQNHACHKTCGSCGLSPQTAMLPAEFVPTTYGLLWAICKDKYFVCHGNQPHWRNGKNLIDLSRLRICGNLAAIKDTHHSALMSLAEKTMSEIHTVFAKRAGLPPEPAD